MKAITIKQPWASLIVEHDLNNIGFGIKPIENRTWPCPKKYIGERVLVHASAKSWKWNEVLNYLSVGVKAVLNSFGYDALWLKNLPTSVIIGSVEIIDCVINHPNIWAEKTGTICGTQKKEHAKHSPHPIIYNWVLSNPVKFPEPIPVKGKLSFWDYPNILAEPEEENGELFCHCQLPVKEESQVMRVFNYFECRYCGGKWFK